LKVLKAATVTRRGMLATLLRAVIANDKAASHGAALERMALAGRRDVAVPQRRASISASVRDSSAPASLGSIDASASTSCSSA
jgi:hypothetical protein